MQPETVAKSTASATKALSRVRRKGRRALCAGAGVLLSAALLPTMAGATAAGAATTVSFTLSMQNANVKFSDPLTYDIVTSFEKLNPNIKVVVQGQPVDQHESDMEVAAESHTLPDVFWVEPQLALPMAQNGDLLNLAPVFKSLGITSHFNATSLQVYTEKGFQYGMPYQPLVTGFFYNMALLRKYNVALPTTLAQLTAAAKVFNSHGLVTIAQGANNTDFAIWGFLIALDRFGYQSHYQQLLAGKMSWANPAFLNYYGDIQQLQKAGAFPSNVSTQTYAQALQSFLSGKSVMVDAGAWAVAQIQASSIGKDVGFWWGPTFPNGVGDQKIDMNVPDAPLSVSAAVKSDPAKLAAVEKFISYYYSNAAAQLFVKNGQPPVTKYVPAVNAKTEPVFSRMVGQLHDPGWTSALFQPDQVMAPAVQSAFYQSVNGVMEGVYSPSQAAQVVATAIKANPAKG